MEDLVLLIKLLFIIIVGITSGFINYFIDFCFNDGNIFDFYYKWVKSKIFPNHPKLAKVLGICPICFGFWVSITIFFIYKYFIPEIPYILIIPYMATSTFTTLKVFKL